MRLVARHNEASRRPLRMLSRAKVTIIVVIEIVIALGMMLVTIIGPQGAWPVILIVAVVVATLFPWRAGLSPVSRGGRRIAFRLARMRRRSQDLAPPPFDIPVDGPIPVGDPVPVGDPATNTAHRAGPRADPDRSSQMVGARWADNTLITVLAVHAPPTMWRVTPHSLHPAGDEAQVVPLDVLAECLNPYDIPLQSIDVVCHGRRSTGSGPVTEGYLRTLGPLPAVAHRTVLVILRLDPRQCTDAIRRRGGGSLGALRAASITTRRVARRLVESGLTCVPLSAAEITSVTSHLIGGVPADELAESWTEVAGGRLRMRTVALDPTVLGQMTTEIWATPSAATTLTIRLSRSPGNQLRVSGLVRFDDIAPVVDSPHYLRGSQSLSHSISRDASAHRFHELNGSQFDAVTTGLPVACHSRLDRRLPAATSADAMRQLAEITIPVSGCGQLIGAESDGSAIAMPLAAPQIATVSLDGTAAFLAHVVLRTVAIGVPVVVHTAAPHRWQPLMDAVSDRRMLCFADDHPRPAGAAVFDGVEPPPSTRSALTHYVIGHPDAAAGHLGTPSSGVHPGLRISLVQDHSAPQHITVRIGSTQRTVVMVATPEECALIGLGQPVLAAGVPR